MRPFPKYSAQSKDVVIKMIIDDVRKLIGPGDPKKNNLVALYKAGKYNELLDSLGSCSELIGFGTALMYLSLAQFDDDLVKEFDIVCQNVFFWSEKLSCNLASTVDFKELPDEQKSGLVNAILGKADKDSAPDLSKSEIYAQYPAPEKMFA